MRYLGVLLREWFRLSIANLPYLIPATIVIAWFAGSHYSTAVWGAVVSSVVLAAAQLAIVVLGRDMVIVLAGTITGTVVGGGVGLFFGNSQNAGVAGCVVGVFLGFWAGLGIGGAIAMAVDKVWPEEPDAPGP